MKGSRRHGNIGRHVSSGGVLVPFDNSYKLVFDDEFNGTTLDTTKWTSGWFSNAGGTNITKPTNTNEVACYAPAQITVSGGALSLTAIAQSNIADNGQTYNWTTGMISTGAGHSKYYATLGYFEAQISCPYSSGTTLANWPAWWMNGDNWPTTGEIDIMEGLSGTAFGTYHGPPSGANQSAGGRGAMGGGYHIFAVWWRSGRVDWYYDNTLLGSVTTNVQSSPLYMILANQVGPTIGGPTVVPSTMLVDWVHVYQSGGTPVTPQAGYTGPGGGAAP